MSNFIEKIGKVLGITQVALESSVNNRTDHKIIRGTESGRGKE